MENFKNHDFRMRASSKYLIEAIINAIDDLEKRKVLSGMRKQQKGIGVRAIYNALQTAQFDSRASHDIRIQHSNIFEALCTSIESLSIFQFEGADAYDIYFSLKGPKEDMLAISSKIQEIPTFDKSNYDVQVEPVPLHNFELLIHEMNSTIKQHSSLKNSNEELQRAENDLQQQISAINNPSTIPQVILNLQDSINKMSTT